ncbi:AIR synthase-related protein [Streptomyces cucumeris]|uniref:AIR synthase-related protein n=1 Tax=Streptomyces cucumeris TaxID=2962890 RepID=UPI003D74C255
MDVYTGSHEGLRVVEVEVELEDMTQARNFEPPSWFGPEITDRPLGENVLWHANPAVGSLTALHGSLFDHLFSTTKSLSKECSMAKLSNYRDSGVDYHVLDRIKREAIDRAKATSGLLGLVGAEEVPESRGASAYVFKTGGMTMAMVIEGLGTKSLIAHHVLRDGGPNRYADVAVDAVAAIVNDVVSVGAAPLVITAYFSTGDAAWYADKDRATALLSGWQRACEESGATWGGGESPALPGLVAADGLELAGSALGIVPPGRDAVLGQDVAPGDRIVLLASSGLHANGASLARRVAADLPQGYSTDLPSGRTLGEALLDPSIIYARFVRALLASEVRPKFLNGVTGHGLMKVMRAPKQVRYVLETVPEVPEVLDFLTQQTGMSTAEAYGTLNMGIGYAAVVAADDADETVRLAEAVGYQVWNAGEVVTGDRSLSVPHLGIEFADGDLRLG